MNLNLKRPLVFIDLEATGLNVATDRIVEIALLKIYPNGNREFKSIQGQSHHSYSRGGFKDPWHL